jgi:dihydroorotate dehydrogenase electron transfer subunit
MRITKITDMKTESPTVKTVSFTDSACSEAKPGQFLMLWVPGIDEIPFSVLDVDQNGVVSIAVKCVGDATEAIHKKNIGEFIGIRGPFGNNFTMKDNRVLMVGGGTGVAPLLFLSRRSISTNTKITFVLGAKTKSELVYMNELLHFGAKRIKLLTSTEDGSCGITGLCTEQVERILDIEKVDMIYACGPEQMIYKVFELAENHKVKLQASLERWMKCAIGLCGSCTIGKYRVCADGPIFASEKLRAVKKEFGSYRRDEYGRKVPIA